MQKSTNDVSPKRAPLVAVGLLTGMGSGVAIAALSGLNLTLGLGLGMFAGAVAGIIFDSEQPRRSRIALALFASALLAALGGRALY